MASVFADLNRGSDVTRGLKKVDPSMQTHKNPGLRAGSTVLARSDSNGSLTGKSTPPGKKPKPESMRTKKPPRQELRAHIHGGVDRLEGGTRQKASTYIIRKASYRYQESGHWMDGMT